MARRLSVSSQPEELVRMTSEDIRNRKWTEAEKEAIRRAAADRAAGLDLPESEYEDIPRLTAEQLARLDEASKIELGFPHDFFKRDTVRGYVYGGTRELIDNHRA